MANVMTDSHPRYSLRQAKTARLSSNKDTFDERATEKNFPPFPLLDRGALVCMSRHYAYGFHHYPAEKRAGPSGDLSLCGSERRGFSVRLIKKTGDILSTH